MAQQRFILAGGSGLLGRAVARLLAAEGHDVVVLSRSPRQHRGPGRALAWDGQRVESPWLGEVDGSAGVVNLAGRNLSTRWTAEAKRQILASRVESAAAIAEALRRCTSAPPVWVNAGAVGIYGDRGEESLTEESPPAPPGSDFLVDVCRAWEHAATAAELPPGVRRVMLRTGVALSAEGGALPMLARLTRLFAGGRLGSGRQWLPWIHADDVARVIHWALTTPSAEGIYNATSPYPVTNAEFMRTLRRVLRRPPAPPAPAWAARLGGWVLGVPVEPALGSQRVMPRRLEQAGFRFAFPELRPALAACFAPEAPAAVLASAGSDASG